jgi:hypothetical protein
MPSENGVVSGSAGQPAAHAVPVDAATVQAWTRRLLDVARDATDAERIDLLRALEGLTCAAAGAQAVVTADFDASQRAHAAARGVPAERQGRGIASQVALARRESPHRGQQHLGLAKVLQAEMPHTRAALRAGKVTEWRATLLARETACLSLADRQTVDRALAGDADALAEYGERELVTAARKLAYQLDPEAYVARRRRAESERRVTLRPAPDVMSILSATLPVAHGVAVLAALRREADRLSAQGDSRSRGQLMADTLVACVTGAVAGAEGGAPVVPVSINLVMSQAALLQGTDEPAHLHGVEAIPADLARQLVRDSVAAGARTWLRRLFTRPGNGQLVAMESRARLFPAAMARFLELRDQTCRTPWCDAPIRHHDHVEAHEAGGPTSARNGQGLCEACNLAKEAHGWQARPRPGPRHAVETVTPTGHRYTSRAPAPPGTAHAPEPPARLDLIWADMTLAA